MTPPKATAKRFVWALGLSLLVHLILTFGPAIPVPEYHPEPVLEATLKALPPAPPSSAAKPPKPRPKPLRHHRTAAPTPAPPAGAATAASPGNGIAAPASSAIEEAAPSANQKTSVTETEQEPSIPLPELAEIRYTLHKGQDGFTVGKAEHTWKREGRHYTITQIAEASGIFSLIASGRHVQISQGEITPAGLQPASYWVQRGQSPDKTDTAQFDWQSMQLTYGTAGDTSTVPLPTGTQDLLSFLYQLAFAPPQSGSTRLYITNGRKLDNYGYQALGEETLELQAGAIKTLHIGKLRQTGEENTEIWLATEYHYLPVKIRFTDKQGGVMEQTAAAINIR